MLTERAWRPEAVILFIGLQIACIFMGAIAVGLLDHAGVAAFQLPDPHHSGAGATGFGAVVVGTLSFQGATLGLIALFLWMHDTDWRDFFGLRDPHLGQALGWALVAVLVLVPLLGGLQDFFTHVLTWLHLPPEKQIAVELVESMKSLRDKIYIGAFTVVIAPVAEEFIFRGLLFPFVKQLGFPRTAWFGVSALFGLIHWDAAIFVPLFVLALVLTWLYNKTGNLLVPITVHILFNGINFFWLLQDGASSTS